MKRLLFFIILILIGCGGGGNKSKDKNRVTLTPNTTWQWQLTGKLDTSYNVDLYDIDLFDTPTEVIKELKEQNRVVICYFSAGSFEEWREDSYKFDSSLLGNNLDGWEGERWLDISKLDKLAPIMKDRLDLAKTKGCDGVEPDNVDGYTNDTGFNLSYQDQIEYNKFLAKEAKKRGLLIGLKNDLNQIEDLVEFFDFALNEECHFFNECYLLEPFSSASKPIFNAEYDKKYIENRALREELCKQSRQEHIQTLILPRALDNSFRYSCQD